MPTPVSALIHAATMVTAGVYLLMRSSPLIEYSSTVLVLCLWLGAITTVFSSLIGLFQQDIKKVIAYSTMSQLALVDSYILTIYIHQTIYEKIIFLIYYINLTVKRIVIYYLFNLFKVNTLNETRSMSLPIENSEVLTTKYSNKKLNPYYVTGFVDGEGCFLINIMARSKQKLGYHVSLMFKLKLHSRDSVLLENIRNYFSNVGNIQFRKDGYIEFIVSSIKDIEVIINHFDSYPLITQKWSDYQLFKQTFELIKRKEHLTAEGLKKALSFKAVLKNGLSHQLKTAFPDIVPFIKPKGNDLKIKDPHWISGFVDAEVCFFVSLRGVSLIFKVTQHIRDDYLLKEFINYFNCGRYSISSKMAGDYIVTNFSDINNKIIPFFNKYPLVWSKSLDLSDFKQVAKLMENKIHLTDEGFKQIKQIKLGMNRERIYNKSSTILQQGKITSPFNCSRRTYVTLSTLPKTVDCQSNRHYSVKIDNTQRSESLNFNEWLSGLIDGDGQFFVSKKGYANFKIIMSEKDKSALYEIKQKFGGSIKSISRSNALKYKLHHKKGLIKLVHSVNGLIRNPPRILELNKVCELYKIELKATKSLTYYNGWFSGFMDADGSIYLNEQSGQLVLSVTQKNKYLLDPLIDLYCGRIQILSKREFQYSIYRKKEILDLIDNYFQKYPLRSSKIHKLNLVKDFYLYKDYRNLNTDNPHKFNEWIKFKYKWDKL